MVTGARLRLYDNFAGTALDMSRWAFLQFPQPDGTPYTCAEPRAITELSDGPLRVHVGRFENSHGVQPIDNSKHLLLSTANFRLPDSGVAEFSGESRPAASTQPRETIETGSFLSWSWT